MDAKHSLSRQWLYTMEGSLNLWWATNHIYHKLPALPPVMAMHPSLQTRINYPFQWGKVQGFILLLHVDQSGGRVSHHLTKLDPEKRSGWRSCLISESCREEKKRFLSTNFTPHGRNFSFVAITFLSLRLWHCLVIYIYIYISSHKSRWH